MHHPTIVEKFNHFKEQVKITWDTLAGNDIMGDFDQHETFLSKLKEHYGLIEPTTEAEIDALEKADNAYFPNVQ